MKLFNLNSAKKIILLKSFIIPAQFFKLNCFMRIMKYSTIDFTIFISDSKKVVTNQDSDEIK